jgi:hypothetical protein
MEVELNSLSCYPKRQSWPGREPSSGKKVLEIGADLVREILGYLEFYFRVDGSHQNDAD